MEKTVTPSNNIIVCLTATLPTFVHHGSELDNLLRKPYLYVNSYRGSCVTTSTRRIPLYGLMLIFRDEVGEHKRTVIFF